MKLNKSLLTCAITIALSSSFVAQANMDDKQQSTSILSDQVSSDAIGNYLYVEQTSLQGAGNEVLAIQQGDGHEAEVIIIGDGNSTSVEQFQDQNLSLTYTTGDQNIIEHTQNGQLNGALTELTGNDNAVAVSQSGAGILGINNEAINTIQGDANFVDVS